MSAQHGFVGGLLLLFLFLCLMCKGGYCFYFIMCGSFFLLVVVAEELFFLLFLGRAGFYFCFYLFVYNLYIFFLQFLRVFTSALITVCVFNSRKVTDGL